MIHLENGAYGRLPTAVNWIVSGVTIVPYVALLGLRARDIMGYTYVIAFVLFPVLLVLVTLLRPAL